MASAPMCYFPDGSLSTRDTPCKSPSLNGGASACCAFSDVCLDNHLCLGQDGAEVITRGSCTDGNWQSPECAQYCSDVNKSNGVVIHPVYVDDQYKFCCQYGDRPGNNTCWVPTKGSISPFVVEAGLVIYNRTSGSTTPINDTRTELITTTVTAPATVTVTASAFASASTTPSVHLTSSSSSKRGEAIGAGTSGLLGLAFLFTLWMLWRQRRQKQSLRKDVQIWEEKYREWMNAKDDAPAGAEHQSPHGAESWDPRELDGQRHLPYYSASGGPDEIGGAPVYEMANKTGRA